MKKHFCRTLSLMICTILAALAVFAGAASAEDSGRNFLGKPFPDFSATDTEGNTFTLSEALKDHEAVLINIWASYCGPCQHEFPYLNEAYEKYRGRVAFIALSSYAGDTPETIAQYRRAMGISFPMGRDENQAIGRYFNMRYIPTTVIVDRYGNSVFYQEGIFRNTSEVERVLDAFLGDRYTETAVLYGIPKDTSTRAYPVSAARGIRPEGGNYRKINFYANGLKKPFPGYVIPDDSVLLRIEIAAGDDISSMGYADLVIGTSLKVEDMLDPAKNAFVYQQRMPAAADGGQFTEAVLYNMDTEEDPDDYVFVFLLRDESSIVNVVETLKEWQYTGVRWEPADADTPAEDSLQAYIVHVADQDGHPVGGVDVNFCTDTACFLKTSDENGTAIFEAEPDAYHVTIVDTPDGYSWDEHFEMYTTRKYGEWRIRIRKN